MKVFFIKSEFGCFAASEVIETKDFFLVPVPNTYEYTQYSKKLYRCEIEEAVKLDGEGK